MEALLDSSIFPDSWSGLRDRLMMTLLYETGMRQDELIKLKHVDVQVSRRTIKVSGKGGKDRLIPVSETCSISLRNTCETVPVSANS